MAKRKQTWSAGDVFTMPMPNSDSSGIGQVVSAEKDAMDSVLCVFYGELLAHSKPLKEVGTLTPISVQLTTRDLLDSRDWNVSANQKVPTAVLAQFSQLEELRAAGFVGAKIRGSGIMNTLVAAFNGLAPWNSYHDPEYLDSLLVPGLSRPAGAVFK